MGLAEPQRIETKVKQWEAVRAREVEAVERSATGQFMPGHTGLGGRKPGSRHKLAETFVADMLEVWEEEGIGAIRAAIKDKPADVLKVMASILPKDIKISLETMSDGELQRRLDQLTGSLGIRIIDANPIDREAPGRQEGTALVQSPQNASTPALAPSEAIEGRIGTNGEQTGNLTPEQTRNTRT